MINVFKLVELLQEGQCTKLVCPSLAKQLAAFYWKLNRCKLFNLAWFHQNSCQSPVLDHVMGGCNCIQSDVFLVLKLQIDEFTTFLCNFAGLTQTLTLADLNIVVIKTYGGQTDLNKLDIKCLDCLYYLNYLILNNKIVKIVLAAPFKSIFGKMFSTLVFYLYGCF